MARLNISDDLRGIKSTAVSSLYQNRHFSEPTTQSIAQPSLRSDYTKLNPVSFYQSTTTTTTKSPPTKPFVKSVNIVAAKIEDYSLNVQKDSNIGKYSDSEMEINFFFHVNNFFPIQIMTTMKFSKRRTVPISLTIETEKMKDSRM